MSYHFPLPRSVAAAHAQQRARFAALLAAISRQIEADLARIDRCLAALDMLDGDADLEADNVLYGASPYGSGCIGVAADDEASLCGLGSHEEDGNLPAVAANGLHLTDLEGDASDDEPDADAELCGVLLRGGVAA
ncbi:hypothetical protein [Methylobacterium radiodurans]|uniref:Uncharacterized protein n=1 Tax=Methylobacterium radiodurans TaxID=2202828 RepID=A0A2U8VTV1_9HYPH|nr:hypothetical protein [Methylobacterium radiodurans]AWN36536.1 hypothetical protein DK427_13015 [Methylobacterium radiodurans]